MHVKCDGHENGIVSERYNFIDLETNCLTRMTDTTTKVFVPKEYKSPLSLRETEVAIKKIKDFFESNLARNLNLTRVSAPLFVRPETGLNDNLNGVERPVNFTAKNLGRGSIEIV